jgi:hypothetical protein
MTSTYKAVEVSAPGTLRIVERPSLSLERGRSGFGWKHVESATPMPPRSPAFTRG